MEPGNGCLGSAEPVAKPTARSVFVFEGRDNTIQTNGRAGCQGGNLILILGLCLYKKGAVPSGYEGHDETRLDDR